MEVTRQDEKLLMSGLGNRFGIYQLKDGPGLERLHFESIDILKKMGCYEKVIDPVNYQPVYMGSLEGQGCHSTDEILEGLFFEFNESRPKDFMGHSMSVSDIVVLHMDGSNKAYYVDRIGFTELPAFMEALEVKVDGSAGD